MKNAVLRILAPIFLSVNLAACAVGPGTFDGSTGVAGLSLQLVELEAGESFASADGFELQFSHFALAFSGISLGEIEETAFFQADFFDEEVADVVEVEAVPAGDYSSLTLQLGQGEAEIAAFKKAAAVPQELSGHSIFIEAQAFRGEEACVLFIALQAQDRMIEVELGENAVEVLPEEEVEILVAVDPNQVFEGVELADFCRDGEVVEIDNGQFPEVAASLLEGLEHAFLLEAGEDHGHGHTH